MVAGPRGLRANRRRVYGRGAAYGRVVSKASIKCYAISGAVLLVLAAVFIVIGALCMAGVLRGPMQILGTSLVSLGGGAVLTGLMILMMACQASMQKAKASPGQANGRSIVSPAPVPPHPYPSAVPPSSQPPPYSWPSAPPASSVQGPYSGNRPTAYPDPKMGYSSPGFPPQMAKNQSLGSAAN